MFVVNADSIHALGRKQEKLLSEQRRKLEITSPYLQKLSHSNLLKSMSFTNSPATPPPMTTPSKRPGSRTRNGNGSRGLDTPASSAANSQRTAAGGEGGGGAMMLLPTPVHVKEKQQRQRQQQPQQQQHRQRHQSMNERPASAPMPRRGITSSAISSVRTVDDDDEDDDDIENDDVEIVRHVKKRLGSAATTASSSNVSARRRRRHPSVSATSSGSTLIRAMAFRNGSRELSARIAARNLIEFLEVATERLACGRAARRLFTDTGEEIGDERALRSFVYQRRQTSHASQLACVYVSCGEEWVDPFARTKELIDRRKSALWTSSGVHFLSAASVDEGTESASRLTAAAENGVQRRLTRTARLTKRLVVYENGSEHNPTLVVIEVASAASKAETSRQEVARLERSYLDDFLAECTFRQKQGGHVKCAYNWQGKAIESIEDVPK